LLKSRIFPTFLASTPHQEWTSMLGTDLVYATGDPPGQPPRVVADLWAYEPDRESPERLRIMEHPSPAPHSYLSDGREREERQHAPKRPMSMTSPS